MLKSWALCLFLAAVSFMLTGCWDRTEINDLAIGMASGVDAARDGKIKYTVQFALPMGIGQQPNGGSTAKESKSFLVESASGSDVRAGVYVMQERLSRKYYLAQRRILVIGEDLARRGVQPVFDYFSRDPKSRMRTFVLVAKRNSAENILRTAYPLEKLPTVAIREMVLLKMNLIIDLKDINRALAARQSLVIPAIEILPQGDSRQKMLKLSGAAIFRGDKLAGWLDDRKTRGLIWLRKQEQKVENTVKIPHLKGRISTIVLRSKTKIQAKKEKGQIVLHANIDTEEDIEENSTELDLSLKENVKAVERVLSEDLRKRIESTVEVLQHRYKSDVAGFGEAIDRSYPKDWERMKDNWDDKGFPQLKVVVHTSVKVRRIGMSGPPLTLPKKQLKKEVPKK